MKIKFLGTGTSTGVPELGCVCPVCTSNDPRDHRLRTSALVKTDGGKNILIDCGPDFRQQMLQFGFSFFRTVLLTHEHYDHVGGLDDLRPYNLLGRTAVYADVVCARHLKQRLPYCFHKKLYPGVPLLELHVVVPGKPFRIGDEEVLPFEVMHGGMPILGYRIGRMVYITDLSAISDEVVEELKGVPFLVINALRDYPHHSHQTLEEALDLADRLEAQEAYFIHMSHRIGLHADVDRQLPPHRHLAYDGLEVHF